MRKLSKEEAVGLSDVIPGKLPIPVWPIETLYENGYAVVALNEAPDEVRAAIDNERSPAPRRSTLPSTRSIDLRPWYITVTAVEKVSRLGHEPSYIPAIKAMCAVGRDENGYGLGLAAAKVVVDNIAAGKPYVFQLPYAAGAVAARSILEEGGMTVTLSREP